jgi:hypothetical protein
MALYAISGGPTYPVSTDLSGFYAGVMKPKPQASPTATPSGTPATPTPTPSPTASPEDHNSLGVFSFAIPQGGVGTGVFALFSHGEIYVGSIAAEADPTRANFNAVLRDTASSSAATNELNGTMEGRAVHTITAPFSSVGVQLRGHAMLDFENSAVPDVVVRTEAMRVRGFKQSADTSLAATPTPAPTAAPTANPSATPTPTP